MAEERGGWGSMSSCEGVWPKLRIWFSTACGDRFVCWKHIVIKSAYIDAKAKKISNTLYWNFYARLTSGIKISNTFYWNFYARLTSGIKISNTLYWNFCARLTSGIKISNTLYWNFWARLTSGCRKFTARWLLSTQNRKASCAKLMSLGRTKEVWTHLLNVWTFDIYLQHVVKILCKNSCVFENKHFSFFHIQV